MKPLTYLTLLIATSMTGLGAVFPDMVSVKEGQQVNAFQIGKAEVTWAKWKTVRDWAATQGYDISTAGLGSGEEHPVHSVSWYDAIKWLNAASELDCMTPVYKVAGQVYKSGESTPTIDPNADGYRLPTEVEWEWAARGGLNTQGYTYSGSNTLADVGWYEANSSGAAVDMGGGHGTWPARSMQPNELGLYDMSGNIAEWCWDADGSNRRYRGGNWWDNPAYCTVTFRGYAAPDAFHHSRGFRPARNRLPTLDEIQYPVTRDWMEIEVPEALANPDPDAKRVINVVVVNYLQSKDGNHVDQDGPHLQVANSGVFVQNLDLYEFNKWNIVKAIKAKYCIEEGAKFRGFKNREDTKAKPYFGIQVVKCFNVYKHFQNTTEYHATDINDIDHPKWHWDANKTFDAIGLKDLVEKNNVKEVWFMSKLGGFHESEMATPLGRDGYAANKSGAMTFPVYDKTYVIYNGFAHDTFSNLVHCRGHQYEAQLEKIDPKFFWQDFVGNVSPSFPKSWLPPGGIQGNNPKSSPDEEWRTEFLGWRLSETGQPTSDEIYYDYAKNIPNAWDQRPPAWIPNPVGGFTMNQGIFQWKSTSFVGTKNGCTHFAPNSNKDYAYDRSIYINSNIKNWSPDSTQYEPVNNQLWNFYLEIPDGILPKMNQVQWWIDGSKNNTNEGLHPSWLITWFQTIPSDKPIIFNRIGGMASQVENWWDIIFDWDDAIKSGKKLYRNGLMQTIAEFAPIPNKMAGAAPFSITAPSSTSALPVELSVISGPATIAANNTITLSGSGTVVIAANQKGNATYLSAEEVTTIFLVTNPAPSDQTIGAFNAISEKVYGDAPFVVTTPASSSNLPVVLSVKSGPATVSGNIVTLTGSGSVVLAANQAGNANYNPAPEVTTTFNVTNPAPSDQTIGAFNVISDKVYGSAPFEVSTPASSSSLPVLLSVQSGPATVNGNIVTLTGSGSVVLAANQAGNANYNPAPEVMTSFLVTNPPPADQTIAVFNAIGDKVYGDAPFEVTTPASSSNLPVVLSVQSGPATVSGNIVTLTGSGSVVLAANQAGNANYNSAPEVTTSFHVTKPTPTPVITSSSSANGTIGVNFSYAITSLNSPASFSANGLPSGLKLNKKTGIISGKPTRAGVFTVNLSAENNFGDGTLTLTLTVAPPPPRVAISSISPIAKIDQFFSYQIVASNSPTSFNADGLPTGLDVNTSNGLISGTPTAAGHFNVTILASNDSGAGTAVLKLKVNPPPPVISLGDDLTVAPVRSPFSYQIMASNSPTIYGAKGLPTGLKINTKTGLISGKPTKAGVFSVQLTAKNASGSGSAFLTLTVQ